MKSASHFIAGKWIDGDGPAFSALNPTDGSITWSGNAATAGEVERAITAARDALEKWADLPVAARIGFIESFGEKLKSSRALMLEAICQSTGKPRWESGTEIDAMIGKVALTIEAFAQRRSETSRDLPGNVRGITRYKPHGVCAVFGPFNFPGHLPNGHILPALIAGNTIVFKPSEQTPRVGQMMAELWRETSAPAGTFNLIQGARDTGIALASHRGVDGIFFTGSYGAGTAIAKANVENPGKILALEMGGNNPLLIHRCGDLKAAAYNTIQSAFITAGQRCSCARRLILMRDAEGDALLHEIVEMTKNVVVGPYSQSPEPFMGPVISEPAARRLLEAQDDLVKRGAKPLVEMKSIANRANMLSPGIVETTSITRDDNENFGPLLQVIRVGDFDKAMREANHTCYGLSASLFSDDEAVWQEFYRRIRAGVVNWNRPTTGVSGMLPFGGIGNSGNHRPSAYFAIDYCNYPVAVMEDPKMRVPATPTPGVGL